MTITHVKIVDVHTQDGNMDYKGLDIMKFVPGKQRYNDPMNEAYLATSEDVSNIPQELIITEDQYNELVGAIPESQVTLTPEQAEIGALKAEVETLKAEDTINKQTVDALTLEILQLKGMV